MSRGYLLDTCVLSAMAPSKPPAEDGFSDWLHRHSDRLFLSAITVAEIEQGIAKLRRAGGGARAARLSQWVDTLLAHGAERVLAFDAQVARLAGGLADAAIAAGRHPGFPDVAIAATAKAHGLVVATRNGRHFSELRVEHMNPVAAAVSF